MTGKYLVTGSRGGITAGINLGLRPVLSKTDCLTRW